MVDLANLNIKAVADSGSWLELLHPVTGEKTGARIKLFGSDSDAFRNKKREISNRRIGSKESLTMERIEADAIELLSACVAEIDFEVAGKKPSAYDLFRDFAWIREQADAFVSDRANFLPQPATD